MKQRIDTEALLARVIEGIQEKKGKQVVSLDLRKLDNAICSYYVICNADSGTQVEAIANSVDEVVREKCSEKPRRTDGFDNALWIVMDYFDIMVHVFRTETRDFYRLEEMWADAKTVAFQDEN